MHNYLVREIGPVDEVGLVADVVRDGTAAWLRPERGGGR